MTNPQEKPQIKKISKKAAKEAVRREFLIKLNNSYSYIELFSGNIMNNIQNLLYIISSNELIELDKAIIGIYSPLKTEPQINYKDFLGNYGIALPTMVNNEVSYSLIKKDINLIKNNLGFLEPNEIKVVTPNILIIPGITFCLNGGRLGRGKGHIDKIISKIREGNHKICVIGVCFEFQIINKLPLELHDQLVDYIITEKQIIKISD